jgi:hypothetical protein
MIYTSLERAKKCKIPFLRERYAYLAIRSIYYSSKHNRYRWIQKINRQFFGTSNKSEIALWALYFENLAAAKPNVSDLARIYWSKSEKSNAAFELYKNQGLKKTQSAVNSSVIALGLVDRIDRCLPELRQISKLPFEEEQLLFVVQRELSKAEDWVLTPYYTHLAPAIETHEYAGDSRRRSPVGRRGDGDDRLAVGGFDRLRPGARAAVSDQGGLRALFDRTARAARHDSSRADALPFDAAAVGESTQPD